jgi:hypothetical protein
MAKAKAIWEGLAEGRSSGTYIRPLVTGDYEVGRWWHGFMGHWRFEALGVRPSRDACKALLEEDDKRMERRSRELNKRGRRQGR